MFSLNFGWLPNEISSLTIEQADAYLFELKNYEPLQDSVTAIRRALFSFMGISDGKPDERVVEKAATAGINTTKLTETEKNAWIDAGMPELSGFLRDYRNAK